MMLRASYAELHGLLDHARSSDTTLYFVQDELVDTVRGMRAENGVRNAKGLRRPPRRGGRESVSCRSTGKPPVKRGRQPLLHGLRP